MIVKWNEILFGFYSILYIELLPFDYIFNIIRPYIE